MAKITQTLFQITVLISSFLEKKGKCADSFDKLLLNK